MIEQTRVIFTVQSRNDFKMILPCEATMCAEESEALQAARCCGEAALHREAPAVGLNARSVCCSIRGMPSRSGSSNVASSRFPRHMRLFDYSPSPYTKKR